jgi:hypothetical protein
MAERNSMTRLGAQALCQKIERYWRKRGFLGIETYLLHQKVTPAYSPHGDQEFYFVRSNIGPSGFPPLFANRVAA